MLSLDQFHSLLGPLPEKQPLATLVVERVQKTGYEQLKVQYDVGIRERISAYVLIPEGAASAPALFCHHQHASNFEIGKSEIIGISGDPDQAIGPELAKLGYVVLAPDAIAFEERNWSLPTGRAEYFELATRIVSGKTLLAKVLHDVSIGVDYLSALEVVDSERIGFIGHSYGGRMAIWAPVFDQRIKVSVSNCGCVNYKDSLDRDIGIQAEFCVPGILEVGDIEDVVELIAPRALYISATSQDKYSRGAKRIFDYAKDAFPSRQIKCKVWDGGHVFTEEMRQAAYQFLSDKL